MGVSQHFCNWLLLALQPAHANQLAYCDCLLLVPCVIRTRNVSLWSHSRRLCSDYIGELLRRYENHTGLLFRHQRDFCHGSMERSYAAPFSKVERHLVDSLCAALKCSMNRYSNKLERGLVPTETEEDTQEWRLGFREPNLLSPNRSSTMLDVCERLVSVLCRCFLYYTG